MKEVYENGTEVVSFETGNSFNAATLIGIVLLKLIAYDDRPERRQKDATDIGNILVNFFPLHQELIYSNHLDMFGEQERTLEKISAIVLGREIKKIISSNANLIDRLNRILNDHINSGEKSIFTQLITKETGEEIDLIIEYLRDILWGFENSSQPVISIMVADSSLRASLDQEAIENNVFQMNIYDLNTLVMKWYFICYHPFQEPDPLTKYTM